MPEPRIKYDEGRYTISAPFDIGPRLQPSLKLPDGSRLTMTAINRDNEGRIVYLWFVDGANGKELAAGDDIRSGVGADVDLEEAFRSFSSFLNAWVEALDHPGSDNRDLFPDSLQDWAMNNDDELICTLAAALGLPEEEN
jgi:hypothetical protein